MMCRLVESHPRRRLHSHDYSFSRSSLLSFSFFSSKEPPFVLQNPIRFETWENSQF